MTVLDASPEQAAELAPAPPAHTFTTWDGTELFYRA